MGFIEWIFTFGPFFIVIIPIYGAFGALQVFLISGDPLIMFWYGVVLATVGITMIVIINWSGRYQDQKLFIIITYLINVAVGVVLVILNFSADTFVFAILIMVSGPVAAYLILRYVLINKDTLKTECTVIDGNKVCPTD